MINFLYGLWPLESTHSRITFCLNAVHFVSLRKFKFKNLINTKRENVKSHLIDFMVSNPFHFLNTYPAFK